MDEIRYTISVPLKTLSKSIHHERHIVPYDSFVQQHYGTFTLLVPYNRPDLFWWATSPVVVVC